MVKSSSPVKSSPTQRFTSVTPIVGDLVPSSDLSGYCTQRVHRHAGETASKYILMEEGEINRAVKQKGLEINPGVNN